MASAAPMAENGAPFAVIIPACNEERVIARTLQAIMKGAPPGREPEIIVVANGCSDRTAEFARAGAPGARVVELGEGSKTAAMNAGNAKARAWPRFFVDADVRCSYASLCAVAGVLEDGTTLAASPAMELDLDGCDRFVRAYYRVWMSQPYVTDNLIGGGVYGLSRAGAERIGPFPQVIGDDVWVRTRFAGHERRNVTQDETGHAVCVRVSVPRRWSDQIRVEARRRSGSEQVRRLYPGTGGSGRINSPADLRKARAAGATMTDIYIYLAMKAAARLLWRWNRLRGKAHTWTRDERSRLG